MDVDRQRVYPRDPFAVDPLPRAHYYPSPERKLSRDQKRVLTAISPQRQREAEKPAASTRSVGESRLSPMDEIFLRNTNSYQSKMTSHYQEVEDNDERFDKSWPSSERPSSMNLTGLEEESPVNLERFQATVDRFTDLKKTSAFPVHDSPGTSPQLPRRAEQMGAKREAGRKPAGKPGISGKSQIPVREKGKPKVPTSGAKDSMKIQEDTGGGSVLQRYIERFRNSAPLSREERERQKESKAEDFWWLSSGSPPAPQRTQSREERSGGKGSETVTPLTTVNLDKYSNLQKLRHDGYQKSSQLPGSPSDRRTKELQDRAEKLLERSSSTILSTEPAVSTEGLGSNTSGMSSLEEYSYRPKFAGLIDEEDPRLTANPYTYKSDIPPHRVVQTRPEDDPLHQWRLRRRMEQAQETAPKVSQSFGFLTKTEQQKKLDSQLEDFKRKLARKDVKTKTPTPGYQFTPAPGQEQVREEEPQIASPVLHRKKPHTETEVDPHLHLMCDLLPCPHRGRYSDMLGNVRTDDSKAEVHKEKLQQVEIERMSDRQLSSKEKSNSDRKFDRENEYSEFEKGKRKQSEDRVKGKLDDKENELFLEIEKLNKEQGKGGGKYKQFLEAEKPDVEKSDSERSLNSDRSRKSDKVVKSDSDRSLKSDRSNVSDSSMKSERSRKDRDKRRKKTDKETVEVIISDKSKSDQKDFGQGSKDERQMIPQDKKPSRRENESEKPSDTGQRSDDKGQRSDDERSRSQGRKEKLRPRLSSSPVRNVEAAIGQVVKNHLFSMSTSTLLSSVDSLPPTASIEGLPRVSEHTTEGPGSHLSPVVSMEDVGRAPEHTPDEPGTSKEPGVTKATDEAAVYDSDGEFEDDDLLLMLRKQRDQYELKLRKIDACLANLDHR